MREWLRVVASDKNTYQLKFFNVDEVRWMSTIYMFCMLIPFGLLQDENDADSDA